MSTEIKQEMARAKCKAFRLMDASLMLAEVGMRSSKVESAAKLALEDYRRANELGQAMLVSLEKAGLR